MVYEEFIDYMVEGLQAEFSTELQVEKQVITRNNGEEHLGLSLVRPNCNTVPVYDMTPVWQQYQDGADAEQLLQLLIKSCHEQISFAPTFPTPFSDFSEVRPYLIVKLIHHEKNAELLEQTPHRDFLDLAVVYCMFFVYENHCFASAAIDYETLEHWDITEEELHEIALANAARLLPPSISSMDQFICEISLDDLLQKNTQGDENAHPEVKITPSAPIAPMYILTNKTKYLGSSAMLYPHVLEWFHQHIGCEFYLLPSSIHEVLLVPKNEEVDPVRLRNMVRDINRISMPAEEILSDEVYEYVSEHELRIVN